jgi:hypothetical protein
MKCSDHDPDSTRKEVAEEKAENGLDLSSQSIKQLKFPSSHSKALGQELLVITPKKG